MKKILLFHFILAIAINILFAISLTGCREQAATPYPTNTYAFNLPTATQQAGTPAPGLKPTDISSAISPELPSAIVIQTQAVPQNFDWRELPAQPEISQAALQIYLSGIQLGRNPQNISVIGDCQAIPYVFLGKYGIRQYSLDAEYYLEPMIGFYRASFAREGYAVRGGFTAASVFSPAQADPAACRPGETPLDCEWRIQNPSIAFINMETWQVDGTVDRYEAYLRRIVEYSISRGTLPILITKADMAEAKTPVINPAMARIAHEYGIPLVNFWQAAQFLENRGIDPDREGFHLTEAGYDLKQKLALLTLYELWNEVHPDTLDVVAQVPVSSSPESTETGSADAPVVNLQCSGNCVYFDLFRTGSSGIEPAGIYELDLASSQLRLISEPGIILQDLSSDQNRLLISRSSNLYLLDRTTSSLSWIMDGLYDYGASSAYFDATGNIVTALVKNGEQNQIVRIDLASAMAVTLSIDTPTAIRLVTYRPSDLIYWQSGECSALEFCQPESLWVTDLESLTPQIISDKVNLGFAPAGDGFAFQDPLYAHELNYFHNPVLFYETTAAGVNSRRMFQFNHPGGFMVHPQIASYAFSQDGSKILVLFDQYSDYFERSMTLYFYLEDLATRQVHEAGKMIGDYGSIKPLAVWSPEGDQVLLLFTSSPDGSHYRLDFFGKNLRALPSAPELLLKPLMLPVYAYPHQAFWVSP